MRHLKLRREEETMIKIWLLVVAICFLLPVNAMALMPPKEIAKKNLEAQLILVGEVMETGKVLLPDKTSKGPMGLFVLKVLHVVKGFGIVSPGDQVRVIFVLPPKSETGIVPDIAGSLPVKVEAGNLVVVYIDPSDHPSFYWPVAGGCSVVIIDASILEKLPAEKKTPEQ
jgi:hypothetical protein